MLRKKGVVRYDSEVAEALGIAKSNLNLIVKGKRKVPLHIAESLWRKFDISKDEVIGNFVINEPTIPYGISRKDTPPKTNEQHRIAVLDVAADANPKAPVRFWDEPQNVVEYMVIPEFSDCKYALPVRGDSMIKDFYPGDLIPLKQLFDFDVIPFGEPFVIATGELLLFKYIRRGPDKNTWILKCANAAYDDIDIDRSKVLALFQVKGRIQRRSN